MNIILIGFMGSGKSTVGKVLSTLLKYPFIDTDTLIEQKANKTIKEIFAQEGEDAFRNYETAVLQSLPELDKQVISTGGGIILRPENRQYLKKAGKVIYLKVNAQDVLNRILDYTTRPLINNPDPTQRQAIIDDLLNKRESLYLEAADLTIQTVTRDIDKSVKDIMHHIQKDLNEKS